MANYNLANILKGRKSNKGSQVKVVNDGREGTYINPKRTEKKLKKYEAKSNSK